MKKIILIIGTRPEIIKMSPVIPHLKKKFEFKIIFTGQHFSNNMKDAIFQDLNIPNPDYDLKFQSTDAASQVAKMMLNISEILILEKPDAVIVHGDTNSTLAGALSAHKLGIKVVHIESGARSGNKNEPEELNRIITDHISYINFPFNQASLAELKKENIRKNIFKLTNTACEACKRNIGFTQNNKLLETLKIEKNSYILSTLHRATNSDNPDYLAKYVTLMNELNKTYPVIIPLHPRTKKNLELQKLHLNSSITIIEPVGYLDFLFLIDHAYTVISDSGGVVDESLVLNTPLIIYRNETERTDALKTRKAVLLQPKLKENSQLKFTRDFLNPQKIDKMKKIKLKLEIEVSRKMVSIMERLL